MTNRRVSRLSRRTNKNDSNRGLLVELDLRSDGTTTECRETFPRQLPSTRQTKKLQSLRCVRLRDTPFQVRKSEATRARGKPVGGPGLVITIIIVRRGEKPDGFSGSRVLRKRRRRRQQRRRRRRVGRDETGCTSYALTVRPPDVAKSIFGRALPTGRTWSSTHGTSRRGASSARAMFVRRWNERTATAAFCERFEYQTRARREAEREKTIKKKK